MPQLGTPGHRTPVRVGPGSGAAGSGQRGAPRRLKDVGDPEAKVLFVSEDDYRAFTGGITKGEMHLP